jgi:hypothetical protein
MLLISSKIKIFSIFDCIVLPNWLLFELGRIGFNLDCSVSPINQSVAVGVWFDRKGFFF